MSILRHTCRSIVSLRLNWLLAVSVLLLAGAVYRNQASRLKLLVEKPITLPVPLKAVPLTVSDWVGRDVAIPGHIQQVAGNDDFLNRLYVNTSTNQWANVYVAYCAHPRTMLGHRPGVCYVAGGWVHEASAKSQFHLPGGETIPCLIHHFHKPAPSREQTVVLNFYVLNGRITSDESSFSGVGWKSPNIAGDPARYVAQVQISSVLENSVRAVARDITGSILKFFPDSNGGFKGMRYTDATEDTLK